MAATVAAAECAWRLRLRAAVAAAEWRLRLPATWIPTRSPPLRLPAAAAAVAAVEWLRFWII